MVHHHDARRVKMYEFIYWKLFSGTNFYFCIHSSIRSGDIEEGDLQQLVQIEDLLYRLSDYRNASACMS